jgi:hypothetical protein
VEPFVRCREHQNISKPAPEPNEKGFRIGRFLATRDEIFESAWTAAFIYGSALPKTSFDNFTIVALDCGSQKQIQKGEKYCSAERKYGGVPHAQPER